MRFNKLWIILTLFMFGFLIQAYDVYAGCCVPKAISGQTQCSGAANSAECTQLYGTSYNYTSQECSSIPDQCIGSCCCIASGGYTWPFEIQYCAAGSGTYHPGLNEQQCQTVCDGNLLETYQLNGQVYNVTNGVQGFVNDVLVTVDRPGVAPVYTSGNGYYVFNDITSGYLTVSAVKGECSWTGNIQFNQLTTLNIILNCCEYECELGECINGQQVNNCTAVDPGLCAINAYTQNFSCSMNLCEWDCNDDDWNPPLNQACAPGQTQRTRTCNVIDTGNCEIGPTPDLTMPCSNATTTPTCGNGIREYPEECDYGLINGQWTGESGCISPWDTIDYCNLGSPAPCTCNYPAIDANCTWGALGPPDINANPVYAARQINLSWQPVDDPNCYEYVDNYKIYGCEKNGVNCHFNRITGPLPKNTVYHLLSSTPQFLLKANTEYCFKLETTFNNSILGDKVQNSSVKCMTMGDEYCLSPHTNSWCGSWAYEPPVIHPAILMCDSTPGHVNFLIQNKSCAGGFCGVNEYGVPTCMTLSTCERCNGLFGIFGYQGFDIIDDDEQTLNCPGPSLTTNPINHRIATKNGEFAGCYLDYSTTSVDKIYSCGDVTTCYDYKSRLSCEQDYCGTFDNTGTNMCEWADYSTLFNKGVCRPKKEYVDAELAVQDCSLCNDPLIDDPVYNRIYGKCTQDTCELYGYCYFKKSTGECIEGNDVSCSGYETQEECIGEQTVVVDTQWSNAYGYWMRVSGTNAVLHDSDDSLEILRCEWDGTSCYRNADNLPNAIGFNGTDCRIIDSKNMSLCERDITPPTTTITNKPHYGHIIDLTERVSSSDNNWPLGDNFINNINNRKDTWIYYSVGNSPTYPNTGILQVSRPVEEQNYKIIVPNALRLNGATLYVSYFGEDAAKNLETRKNFAFVYDDIYPDIELTTSVVTSEGGFVWGNGVTGNWSTDLFVNIQLNSEISMPVVCHYNITPIINNTGGIWTLQYERFNLPAPIPPANNIIYTAPGELGTTYLNLWPDRYKWILECVDDSGNNITRNGTIPIDGDLTISNPFPIDLTYRSNTLPPNISIHTTASGTCKYSRTTSDYDLMENTYTQIPLIEGDYLHYDSKENVFPEIANGYGVNSGIYRIYTACDLVINGQNKRVLAEPTDIIRFAVDDLPPKTVLEYVDENNGELQTFTNNKSEDYIMLYLKNEDYSQILDDGTDMSFGQRDSYYCIASTMYNISCVMKLYNVTELGREAIEFNYKEKYNHSDAQYGANPQFCYYSRDKGMNQEPTTCMTLKLRNQEFDAPRIEIYETQ